MPDEQGADIAQAEQANAGPGTQVEEAKGATTQTYSEEQVVAMLTKAREGFKGELAKANGKLGSRIQSLENTLSAREDWQDMADEAKATFTDAASLAQEHADVLGDKHGLTERQRQIVAKGRTRPDRVEMAEAMGEGKPAGDATKVGDKDTLKGLLEEMGITPRIGATGERLASMGDLVAPQQSQQDFIKAAADDPDVWDPKRAAQVLRSLGMR